jgi:hypothetical protein
VFVSAAFNRGHVARVAKVMPACAIMIGSFDYFLSEALSMMRQTLMVLVVGMFARRNNVVASSTTSNTNAK